MAASSPSRSPKRPRAEGAGGAPSSEPPRKLWIAKVGIAISSLDDPDVVIRYFADSQNEAYSALQATLLHLRGDGSEEELDMPISEASTEDECMQFKSLIDNMRAKNKLSHLFEHPRTRELIGMEIVQIERYRPADARPV